MENRYVNELIHESSPYLRQHAHNPVHWYAWNEEALELARSQQKIILLSIGYSACHWCHVMERESFENPAVADLMNKYFINIKVDREERPDLDHIYMEAVQVLTGSGGWPLNVFLTPEALPFYGGTYFPPVPAHGRVSWTQVLEYIQSAWQERPEEVQEQAKRLLGHITQSNQLPLKMPHSPAANEWSVAVIKNIREQLMQTADTTWGGFGRAPKFPQTMSLRLLTAYVHLFPDETTQLFVEKSVQALLTSGIYDQLGGGMARYSTDVQWMVPHFEKMLYDNALLLRLLCDVHRAFPRQVYVDYIHKTMDFVLQELKAPSGGFWSALDADSEGEEGLYYTWDYAELQSLLKQGEYWVLSYYGICETGNWEGRNILHIHRPLDEISQQTGLDESTLRQQLQQVHDRLIYARNKRVRPQTDDKILIGWNSLLLTAMVNCYWVTDNPLYLSEALDLYQFLRQHFFQGNRMQFHTFKEKPSQPVFLDDLAYFAEACLHLGQATGDARYFRVAADMLQQAQDDYWSESDQLFLYTAVNQPDSIVRKAEYFDNALPSGNSVMAACMIQLGAIFEREDWSRQAETMFANLMPLLVRYAGSFGYWINGLVGLVAGSTELVITGIGAVEKGRELGKKLYPGLFWMPAESTMDVPLTAGKPIDNQLQYYVCRNFSCLPVSTDWQKVEALLKNHHELT